MVKLGKFIKWSSILIVTSIDQVTFPYSFFGYPTPTQRVAASSVVLKNALVPNGDTLCESNDTTFWRGYG